MPHLSLLPHQRHNLLRDLAQLNDVLSTLKRTPGLTNVRRARMAEALAFKAVEAAPEFSAARQIEEEA